MWKENYSDESEISILYAASLCFLAKKYPTSDIKKAK